MSAGHKILRLILLGPASCRGCRQPVWWSITWAWSAWTDRDGKRHRCVVEKVA